MKTVGLTGGIGTGKSTVARMLVKRGARVIDADLLARQVVEPGKPAFNDIVKEFGKEVLNNDGTIEREALARVVFNHEARRRKLNMITHPRIGEEMMALTKKYFGQGAEVVVIDAALLFESAATSWIKPVIVVVADEEVKVQRVCARDGLDPEDVKKRMRSQWSDQKRAKRADYVIDNSSDLAALEERVDEVWQKLREESGAR